MLIKVIIRVKYTFLKVFNYSSCFLLTVKPHNPMVNSGSIIINSLIQTLVKPEISLAEKFDYLNDYIKVVYFISVVITKQKSNLNYNIKSYKPIP